MVEIEVIVPKQTEIKRMYHIIKKDLLGAGLEIIEESPSQVIWGVVHQKRFPKKDKKVLFGKIFLYSFSQLPYSSQPTDKKVLTILSYNFFFSKTIRSLEHLLDDFDFKIIIEEYF